VFAFIGAAWGGHVDVATSIDEGQWFDPAQHWDTLTAYCQEWQGGQLLSCADVFSASQRVAATFRRHQLKAAAFDILTDPSEDILAEQGFYTALNLVLMLPDSFIQFPVFFVHTSEHHSTPIILVYVFFKNMFYP